MTSDNRENNTPPIVGKRKQSTIERRALLVKTAITCFVKNGIAHTGIRDIATAAGVSVGNLYNHFSSKDELIAEIAKIEAVGLSKITDQVCAQPDPVRAVETFVSAYFTYCADMVSAILTIEITAEALRNKKVENLFKHNRARLVAAIVAPIKKGVRAGIFASSLPPKALAELVIDTVEGAALRVGLSGKSRKRSDKRSLQVFVKSALMAKDF